MDDLKGWEDYRVLRAADPVAAEKGRLLAANMISNDADARKRMEDRYGIEFCRNMYPEAYRAGYLKLLDKVRQALPQW
jgi:hypothetical protein